MNNLKSLIFVSIGIMLGCSGSESRLEFIHLKQFDYISRTKDNNGNHVDNKMINYIVKGYTNSKETELAIDKFAHSLNVKEFDTIEHYQVVFFKYSSYTNLKHLKENPRDFDRESPDDRLWLYIWNNGKFFKRFKFDGDEIVGEKEVKIENL